MLYEELHQRYGTYIAKRVSVELTAAEFEKVHIDELVSYLELRAELAHKDYQSCLQEGLLGGKVTSKSPARDVNTLHNYWRSAEDLAYLITVAADITAHARHIG